MNEIDPSNQNTPASSTDAWFQQQVMPPSTPAAPPPRRHKWPFIIGGIVGVVALTLTGLVLFGPLKPEHCIRTDNYSDLLTTLKPVNYDNAELSDLSPGMPFYTYEVYFNPESANLDATISEAAPDFLRSLGTYYRDKAATAPITLTLETSRLEADDPTLAGKRLDVIKRWLVHEGVAESAITVKEPALKILSEESMNDDYVIDGMPVTISIAPPQTLCEQ